MAVAWDLSCMFRNLPERNCVNKWTRSLTRSSSNKVVTQLELLLLAATPHNTPPPLS